MFEVYSVSEIEYLQLHYPDDGNIFIRDYIINWY
jgi:hypothetical protein